jgi:hypothetical protein
MHSLSAVNPHFNRVHVCYLFIRAVNLKPRTERGLPFINHSSLNFLYVTSKQASLSFITDVGYTNIISVPICLKWYMVSQPIFNLALTTSRGRDAMRLAVAQSQQNTTSQAVYRRWWTGLLALCDWFGLVKATETFAVSHGLYPTSISNTVLRRVIVSKRKICESESLADFRRRYSLPEVISNTCCGQRTIFCLIPYRSDLRLLTHSCVCRLWNT